MLPMPFAHPKPPHLYLCPHVSVPAPASQRRRHLLYSRPHLPAVPSPVSTRLHRFAHTASPTRLRPHGSPSPPRTAPLQSASERPGQVEMGRRRCVTTFTFAIGTPCPWFGICSSLGLCWESQPQVVSLSLNMQKFNLYLLRAVSFTLDPRRIICSVKHVRYFPPQCHAMSLPQDNRLHGRCHAMQSSS